MSLLEEIQFKIRERRRRQRKLTRGGKRIPHKLPVNEILPYLKLPTHDIEKNDRYHDFLGVNVLISNMKLGCFLHNGIICAKCGCSGQYFLLERHGNSRGISRKGKHINRIIHPYRLQLYFVLPGGKEMMMTKDHIIPKSRGGHGEIDNLQTMCHRCNCDKGSKV